MKVNSYKEFYGKKCPAGQFECNNQEQVEKVKEEFGDNYEIVINK